MSELPWRCSACGRENMVDFDHLSEWPIDNVLTARGFVCEKCGMQEAILYTNASLKEAVRKLERYSPGNRNFRLLLAKAIRRAERIQQRGEAHGAF